MRLLVPAILVLFLASALSAQRPVDEPDDMKAVVLIEGAQSVQMKESVASRKGRGMIGASKQYFIFGGPRAALRTKTVTPVFQFDADPGFDDPVYLFRLDMHSDRREIRVAKGFGGLAELSIPKDHIIPTSLEVIGDGQNSTKRYRLKPTTPLRPGEYCLSRNISVCFDFGVD
jgi:hypothetical protein